MNNPYLKTIFATGMLSLSPWAGYTQVAGGLGGASPDPKMVQGATSSGLSSIYSPNVFDGSTTVTVPIQGFSQGGQEYGISLNYNTKGVRVDECATPAGLHWNIMAEGTITRIIKDLPDELNMETAATIDFDDTSFINQNRYLKGKYVTYTETPAQQATPNVYRDGECDDFIFSCAGQTFTFNLGKEMNVFTHPHRNIKVTPLIDGTAVFGVEGQPVGPWGAHQYDNLLEFLIRDEGGTQYYFVRGDYEQRMMYTNEYYEADYMGFSYPTIKWVIKKITFANGNEINYNYSPQLYSGSSNNYKQYYAREIWSGSNPTSGDFLSQQDVAAQQFTIQLQSIQYPNGTEAAFVYDANNNNELSVKQLKEIKVSSGSNCIRYKLNQSQVNNRWFLNSVKLSSCDGTLEEPYYSFEYNPLALPDRLSSAQDLYGYYNGNPNGQALGSSGAGITIPKHHNFGGSLSYLNYGSDRSSNSTYAQAGILTKVKNAFGGEISFTYTTNLASNVIQSSSLPAASTGFVGLEAVDGLRVESVTEKEKYHPGNSRLTFYEYYDGQIFMPGGYFHYPEYVDSASGHWDKLIFQNMFLSPHQLVDGSNHGYSRVVVKIYEGGELTSMKEMSFTNMSDATSNGQPRYYKMGKDYFDYPYTDKQYLKDWEIGLPLEVKEYDQNQKLVKHTINKYDFSPSANFGSSLYFNNVKRAKVASGIAITVGNPFDYHAYYPNKKIYTDTYLPFTGRTPLRCTNVRTYISDTRYIEDSTVYAYDDRHNIKKITTLNSKGEKFSTEYVYNYEVGGTTVIGGAAPGSVLYNMTETGLEQVVSTERWKLGTGSNVFDQKLVDANVTTFNYQGGVLRTKGAYSFRSAEPFSYSAYTGLTMGGPAGNPYAQVINIYQGQVPNGFEKTTEIKIEDAKGNPLQTQLLGLESFKSMIWDMDKGKLLAEVANAKYKDIAFSGFETDTKGNLEYNPADILASASVPGGGISGNYVLRCKYQLVAPEP